MELTSQIATLDQLSAADMLDLLELRAKVFVLEQDCVYQDPGEEDRLPETRHILLRDPEGHLAAYIRLLGPGGDGPEPLISRVVSDPALRGQGLGHRLMLLALEQVGMLWPGLSIRLHAQTYLEEFYRSHGFEPLGDVYLLDGLDHIEMVRPVTLAP
ncbi:MAG: GNAT family N-acetyltransferase [bacterium]|nr:GNAT family N-acetyltransferase [bacterium]